jgi:uncharacterized short protein YbdD (DUF466 family)
MRRVRVMVTGRQARAVLRQARGALGKQVGALGRVLRAIAGDDAYERYLEHAASHHPGEPLMRRRDFYRDAEQRKWSGVSRCC